MDMAMIKWESGFSYLINYPTSHRNMLWTLFVRDGCADLNHLTSRLCEFINELLPSDDDGDTLGILICRSLMNCTVPKGHQRNGEEITDTKTCCFCMLLMYISMFPIYKLY